MNRQKPYFPPLFVFIQFISIGLLLYTGPLFADSKVLLIIEISGILFGLWAIHVHGIKNFNITPTPKHGAVFIRKGPYRIIRHPMYLAILIALAPLLIDDFSLPRLGVFMMLTLDLIAKLVYEEINLRKQFPEYEEYRGKSWRLIPFVF